MKLFARKSPAQKEPPEPKKPSPFKKALSRLGDAIASTVQQKTVTLPNPWSLQPRSNQVIVLTPQSHNHEFVKPIQDFPSAYPEDLKFQQTDNVNDLLHKLNLLYMHKNKSQQVPNNLFINKDIVARYYYSDGKPNQFGRSNSKIAPEVNRTYEGIEFHVFAIPSGTQKELHASMSVQHALKIQIMALSDDSQRRMLTQRPEDFTKVAPLYKFNAFGTVKYKEKIVRGAETGRPVKSLPILAENVGNALKFIVHHNATNPA